MSAQTEVLDALDAVPLLPVLTIDRAISVTGVVEALAEGGITAIEITLRTPVALSAVAGAASLGRVCVGAGTVLTAEDVDAAVDAGARFVVSPGFDPDVVARARAHGVLPVPGVATATEVMRAAAAGVDHVKLFPAGLLGGPSAVRSLSEPFPGMRFVPSGGVGPGEVADYLARPEVFAVSGSWLAPRSSLDGDLGGIRRRCREAVVAHGRGAR